MGAYVPDTDLWLERSRLDGMLLAGVSYGIFFLLTLQATDALSRRSCKGGPIPRCRWMLLGYVWITFILATVGIASNARYTEMIWIDLRDAPGGPAMLIRDETNYWINLMAIGCYYIMEWLMQAVLLHRCFALWGWEKRVVVPMFLVFAAMVAVSILVLSEFSRIGLTIIYTLLVAGRLFAFRKRLRDSLQDPLDKDYVRPYQVATVMVIESAAPYSVLAIIFLVSFAMYSNVTNLVFMSIGHVQGIAQLLIIIRAAKGIGCRNTSRVPHTLTWLPCSQPSNDAEGTVHEHEGSASCVVAMVQSQVTEARDW